VIKLATLAPEGTDWHGALVELAQQWKEATNGEVIVRIYPNGVVGDERDMIRKMRIGQIHAAAITMDGLSELNPDVYAFYIPLLFDDYDDVDWIRERIAPDLVAGIEANGFILLNWADVGWAYWFTREPIVYPEDLKKQRIFAWAGDYKTAELWKKGGFNPVQLASIDVLSGLQTGLVDAVGTNPMVALSMQWFGVAHYMLDMKWGLMTAATVIDQRVWNRISPENQEKMLAIARQIAAKNQSANRHRDQEAIQVMKKYGLVVHHQTPEEAAYWRTYVKAWYPLIRGYFVREEMFDKIIQLKAEKDRLDQNAR
jgi:TRAP-type C4-dicarboxylate transport system substrate-binding protein